MLPNKTLDRKIEKLKHESTFEPVKKRPGYWRDVINGQVFHYTQFEVS